MLLPLSVMLSRTHYFAWLAYVRGLCCWPRNVPTRVTCTVLDILIHSTRSPAGRSAEWMFYESGVFLRPPSPLSLPMTYKRDGNFFSVNCIIHTDSSTACPHSSWLPKKTWGRPDHGKRTHNSTNGGEREARGRAWEDQCSQTAAMVNPENRWHVKQRITSVILCSMHDFNLKVSHVWICSEFNWWQL